MKTIRTILCIMLVAALLAGSLPVSAISTGFFKNHEDWHFDLTREPDRAMTVEEMIALSTAYSYWTTGTNSGTLPKDKNGHLPSDWAAPYIRNEYAKGTVHPELIAYDAPATLADWIQFMASCKGLYSFNAQSIYDFSGADNLTPEQILLMSAAIDYGLISYRQGMDVSTTLPRKDLEQKYMIPSGEYKTPADPIRRKSNCKWSMIYFEDCYNDTQKSKMQLENIKKYEGCFNLINLDALSLKGDENDGLFVSVNSYRRPDSIAFNPYHMELIDYCKEKDITIVAGAFLNRNDGFLKALKADPSKMKKAANELMDYVNKYKLDGLNLVVEMYDDVYRSTYSSLLKIIYPMFHEQGKLLIVTAGGFIKSASAEKSLYDYEVINACSDLVVLTLYDDHSTVSYEKLGGQPGEVSSYESARRRLLYAIANFGAQKVLVTVGTYGVDFNLTKHTAESIPRDEIFARAKQYNAKIQTHGMPVDDAYFEYQANDGSHIVYFDSDEGLLRRLALAPTYGTGGVCFYESASVAPKAFEQAGVYLHTQPSHSEVCPSGQFSDAPAYDNWAHEGIDYCIEHELMNGVGKGLFNPNGTVTRAQLVTILYRMADQPRVTTAGTFDDVPTGIWYSDAIEWAAANNIVNGVGDRRFNPMGNITREQIATILYRYEGNPKVDGTLAGFPDSGNVRSYAVDALIWATDEGLINGIKSNNITNLAPQNNATRAQIASIIMRYLEN